MKNLIKGEFFKLKKSKGIKFTVLLTLISSILLFLYIELSLTRKSGEFTNLGGIDILHELLGANLWGNFLFALVAAIFIVRDFEKQTINITFTYGYKKLNILVSKFLVYSLASIVLWWEFIIISTLCFTVLHGFGVNLNMSTLLFLFKITFISILCSIATTSITFTIGIITRNSICTLISPIIICIIYNYISGINNPIISNLLPFDLLINVLGEFSTRNDVILSVCSSILTTVIMLLISNLYLRKKEFK